jgi:hypothetical protein
MKHGPTNAVRPVANVNASVRGVRFSSGVLPSDAHARGEGRVDS